jgi:hypothetical protein
MAFNDGNGRVALLQSLLKSAELAGMTLPTRC